MKKQIIDCVKKNTKIVIAIVAAFIFIVAELITYFGNKGTDITIVYHPNGTMQHEASIEYCEGGDIKKLTEKVDDFSVSFKVGKDIKDISSLLIKPGDQSGTLQIESIVLTTRNGQKILESDELEQYFDFVGFYSIERNEDYVEAFTYDIFQTSIEMDMQKADQLYTLSVGKVRSIVFAICIWFIFFMFAIEEKLKKPSAKHNLIINYIVPILFAIFVFIMHTYNFSDMLGKSGDAHDIWETIRTFHSSERYGSYVLYKGINSIYPYLWLYDLAQFIGINDWFFIRLFYCFSFVYVSAIGLPNLIERLTLKKTCCYRRCVLILTLWKLWYYTNIFTAMMIDLPCLVYFLLLVNTALKIYRGEKKIIRYIWAGVLSGLCMTASGQYSVPAICIFIFIVIVTLKKINCHGHKYILGLFVRLATVLMGCFLLIFANNNFEDKVVEPLRNEGAWIPTGDDWLQAGLTRFMSTYRTTSKGTVTIPSNRNASIFQDFLGEKWEEMQEVIQNGGYMVTIQEYLGIFLKYPVDFILCYLNSFFLILSPDGGMLYFKPLFVFYSLLYLALYIGVKRCRSWRQFFSPLFWIGFAFLWATVPMIVMNIEPRTCIQIQGIVVALAVCDDTLWNGVGSAVIGVKRALQLRKIPKPNTIPYKFVLYLVFLAMCFLHISTLYELVGIDSVSILMKF